MLLYITYIDWPCLKDYISLCFRHMGWSGRSLSNHNCQIWRREGEKQCYAQSDHVSTLSDKCEAHSTWLSTVQAKYTHHALFVISLCTWHMNALVWKWFLWRTNGVDWQAAVRNATLSLMQCAGSHFARDSWCKSRENVLTRSRWDVRECEWKRDGEMEMNKMIFYRLSDHVAGGEVVWFLQAQWLTLAFCSLALLLRSFVPVFSHCWLPFIVPIVL